VSLNESGDNAAWAIDLVRQCFPTMRQLLADEGTAMTSSGVTEALRETTDAIRFQAEAMGHKAPDAVLAGLCANHVRDNVVRAVKTGGAGVCVLAVARARTEADLAEELAKCDA
jgi:hypothetical protein